MKMSCSPHSETRDYYRASSKPKNSKQFDVINWSRNVKVPWVRLDRC